MNGTKGAFILDPEGSTETRTIPAGKAIVNGTVYSNEEIDEDLEIIGAYYKIIDSKADDYYYVSPVANAATGILGYDKYTIDIKTFGNDLKIEDVSFIGASEKTVIINIDDEGLITAGTITLNYATLNITGVDFIATITNGEGSVIADGSAVDENGADITFTVSASVKDDMKKLTVTGEFYPNEEDVEEYADVVFLALEGKVTVKDLITTTLLVTGDVAVTGTDSEIVLMKVKGTLTVDNEAAITTEKTVIFGSLVVKDATDTKIKGVLTTEALLVGLDIDDIVDLGATASVSGDVDISSYLFVADGSSIPADLVKDVDSITFYVEGKVWMTVYDMGESGTVTINTIPVDDAELDGWVVDGETYTGAIPFDGNTKAEAKINYKVFTVTAAGSTGVGDIYVDGVLYIGEVKVAAGKHTISFTPSVGYTDKGTMYVNGEKVSGFDFTVVSDVTTYNIVIQDVELAEPSTPTPTPTPVEPSEKDDSMGITEYLLIVLVILAAILVVVVAIRMMRS